MLFASVHLLLIMNTIQINIRIWLTYVDLDIWTYRVSTESHIIIPMSANKNVWMSDKSWEPGIPKLLLLKTVKNLKNSLSTCWTTFVFSVTVSVTCLCWSLGHAEQLLFSCVNSKVSICNYVTCQLSHFAFHMSHVICEMLMLILGTCWTTFVFMSMLKSEYL